MIEPKQLTYNADGLIPAVVQDAESGRVLMLAWMNEESLRISLAEGRTCFYSRSRQELWRKGETSGHVQTIRSIDADCDGDALLIRVEQAGAACHTGAASCFHEPMREDEKAAFSYEALYDQLRGRRTDPKEGSYTSYLFEKGLDKILKKVGEESTEVVIAAKGGDRQEVIYESADLLYHMMVLLIEQDIALSEITAQLAERHVIDKKVKQERLQ